VGEVEGIGVGRGVVGGIVGPLDGCGVGWDVGTGVGGWVGCAVGRGDGIGVGWPVGMEEGIDVGIGDGFVSSGHESASPIDFPPTHHGIDEQTSVEPVHQVQSAIDAQSAQEVARSHPGFAAASHKNGIPSERTLQSSSPYPDA